MPVEGETYVRRLIEDRLRIIADSRGDPANLIPSIALQDVQAAGDALVAVGALGPERAKELLAGFRQTLLDTGVIREVRASARAEATIAADAVDDEAAERWRAIVERRGPAAEPVRVVPVVREVGRLGHVRVIVL